MHTGFLTLVTAESSQTTMTMSSIQSKTKQQIGGGYISSPLVVGNSGTWTFSRPTPRMELRAHLTWDGTLRDAASEHIL